MAWKWAITASRCAWCRLPSINPKWDDIEIAWDDASQPMESLLRLLDNLLRDMGDEVIGR